MGPCGEQKGKALSGATIGSVVANSPSPLWIVYKKLIFNLVDFFMPKKLHQKCTDPVSTHFYGRFSNCTYPIHHIPLSHSTWQHEMWERITSTHSLMNTTWPRTTRRRITPSIHKTIFISSRHYGDYFLFFSKKNRRICNYLRIKRLFGLLGIWVTRWQPFLFQSPSLFCINDITLDTQRYNFFMNGQKSGVFFIIAG